MIKPANLLIAILFVCSISSLAIAQEKGDLSFGAGVAYGFDIEEIGLQVNGTYSLNEKMRVGADFIYWLIDNEFIETTGWELNGNFHYLFYNENDLVLYGVGSLGLHSASNDYKEDTSSDSVPGLGLGAGLEYLLGPVKFYAEPRIFLSGLDQFALSAGIRVPF